MLLLLLLEKGKKWINMLQIRNSGGDKRRKVGVVTVLKFMPIYCSIELYIHVFTHQRCNCIIM